MAKNNLSPKLRTVLQRLRARPTPSTAEKNKTLLKLAADLRSHAGAILAANAKDLKALPPSTSAAFRDRLLLNPQRIAAMAKSLKKVAALPDPVGEVVEARILPNGLSLRRVRAPLGVLFMVFESRPNVITEAFSLAYKSGNAIVLRGGSDSRHTSRAIYDLMRGPFYGLQDYDRDVVKKLLKAPDWIDVVIPRGGDKLIQFVQKTAQMPVIKNDRGLCHAYVAADADIDMAIRIVINGKMQRPGVCNALETVLVEAAMAPLFLPRLYQAAAGLKWRVDAKSAAILKDRPRVRLAKPKDWDTEYLDLILNCRVVQNIDEALAHIAQHGSRHSETIVTPSEQKARRFQDEVDAAAVYWNASTRFTDGFELGLGGELGISTQKLHVRGPVGLRELTTPRWVIDGTGQIRE